MVLNFKDITTLERDQNNLNSSLLIALNLGLFVPKNKNKNNSIQVLD